MVTLSHFEYLELPPTYLLYIIALKQTQALEPHIKAETQAEVSTDSPEPVSTWAVKSRCEGVCKHLLFELHWSWEQNGGICFPH